MRPEILIARRLTLGNGSRTPLGIRIGIFGVALAFVVMLISVAVVTGFKKEISRKVTGFECDLLVRPPEQGNHAASIDFGPETEADIRSTLGDDVTIDGLTELQALLKTDSDFEGIMIRCLSAGSPTHAFIEESLTAGELPADSASVIVISRVTARKLNLNVGDKVFVHFFIDDNLKTRRLTVSGIYDTHFEDYDSYLAFGSVEMARSVNGWPSGRFSEIAIDGIDRNAFNTAVAAFENKLVSRCLADGNLGQLPQVSTVYQRGALYFNWLDLLDTNVVVIIVLMAVVSAFTIISSLFILILQRVSTIGLLKSLGATDRQISDVFLFLGQKIVLRGLLWGNVVGCILIALQYFTHILPLDPDAYYLTYVPVDMTLSTWLLLNVMSVMLAFMVLMLPARTISRMSVTAAMNYRRLND